MATPFPGASVEPVVWLDASEGVTTGDTFTWADQSDSDAAHDAIQADALRQPTLQMNVINGMPVVRFDSTGDVGNPDWLQIADHADVDIGLGADKGFTAFFVSKINSSPGWYFDKRPLSGGMDYGLFDESGANRWLPTNSEQHISSIGSVGFHIRAYSLDQTFASGGTTNVWLDGTPNDANPRLYINKFEENNEPLYIGRHGQYSNDFTFNGDFAEIIIFNTVLSGTDMNSTGSYLTEKYNLSTSYTPVNSPDNDFEWAKNDLGSWTSVASWGEASFPNTQDHTVTFGSAATGTTAAVLHSAVTVNRAVFNNSNQYIVAGGGSVNLESNSMGAAPTIEVITGSHQFQVMVNLLDHTTASIASGSTLTFNNELSLTGKTLTKTGAGVLEVNNVLTASGGTVIVQQGTVSGNGTIGGDVNNGGGTISPGANPSGTLAIPEPATALLLGIGMLLATGLLRRSSADSCVLAEHVRYASR